MKLWTLVLALLAAAPPALAARWLPVLPQDDVLPATLQEVYDRRETLDGAVVVVDMGHGEDNPRWEMGATMLPVFFQRILEMPAHPLPIDDVWPKVPAPDPAYRGLVVLLHTTDGKRFAPLRFFSGRVEGPNGTLLAPDHGRGMEYWLFGTARVRRDQMLGATVLPVLTFEQCRLLGQRIVNTQPRQCLLPDNNLLLESAAMPTVAAARVRTFDGCLEHGAALIYTFPRRCMTVGGRVFTEPPRVYEPSGTMPAPANVPVVATPMGLDPATLDGLDVGLSSTLVPVGGASQGTPLVP